MIMTRYGSAIIDGQKKCFPVLQREFKMMKSEITNKAGETLLVRELKSPEVIADSFKAIGKIVDLPKGLTEEVFNAAKEEALSAEARGAELVSAFKKNASSTVAGIGGSLKSWAEPITSALMDFTEMFRMKKNFSCAHSLVESLSEKVK